MDYPLFSKCFELFYADEQHAGCMFRKRVGFVFFDKVSLEMRKGDLFERYKAVEGFLPNPKTTNLETIIPNLRNADEPSKPQADAKNATVLTFVALTTPEYSSLKPLIEEGLDEGQSIEGVLEKYRKRALIALGRNQPNLVPAAIDVPYEDLILHYAYDEEDKIEVVGRDKQQGQLREFLKDERPFLWVQLAGAAGQGKSRLAFDLIREAKDEFGYDAGYMRASDLADFFDDWLHWQPDCPKLVIVDYVHEPGKRLGPPLAVLANRAAELSHSVRFLLLERQPWNSGAIDRYTPQSTPSEDDRYGATEADFSPSSGYASWFFDLQQDLATLANSDPSYRHLKAADVLKKNCMLNADGVIRLDALTPVDLRKLVKKVAKQQDAKLTLPVSDSDIDKALRRFDNAGRPLYAYFLGIALADRSFQETWERTDLLDRILTIYQQRRWDNTVSGSPPDLSEDRSSLHLAAAATVLRALALVKLHSWPFGDVSGEQIKEALTVLGAPRGGGAGELGNFLPGMLPDLLGEWFVLRVLTLQSHLITTLICWCWRVSPDETAAFMQRVAQDFPEEPATFELLSLVCSTETDTSRTSLSERAAAIIRALIDRVADCPIPVAQALELACDNNNGEAMGTRAFCHWKPFHFKESHAAAVDWWNKAAKKSHVASIRNLGVCNQLGIGVDEPDIVEAMRLYREAAEAGDTKAKVNLAVNLEQGIGIDEPDIVDAMRLYREAADAGDTRAKVYLAINLKEGIGVDAPDHVEAMRLYREAADAGDTQAKVNLAINLQQGTGVDEPDIVEAMRLYREAADAGDTKAKVNLAVSLEQGIGVDEPDIVEAMRLYREAADAGDTRAKFNLAVNLEQGIGVDAPDHVEAMRLYREAANAGHAQAKVKLAVKLQQGKGVDEPDIVEAMRLYSEAADAGDKTAIGFFAKNYVASTGVDQISAHEFDWLNRAANAGDEFARELLVTVSFSLSRSLPEYAVDVENAVASLSLDGLWMDDPPLRANWQEVEPTDAPALVEKLSDTVIAEGISNLFEGLRITAMRAASLACYPDLLLVDVQTLNENNQPLLFTALVDDVGALLIDGTSSRILILNKHRLSIVSSTELVEYLRFYCQFARGNEGPFEIIESIDQIPLPEKEAAELAKANLDISPMEATSETDGNTHVRNVSLLYSNALFKVEFRIDAFGNVEMLDETPLRDKLPISRRRYSGVFRSPLSLSE